MELKTDISFRASDGTDPDRVRADLEILNQRMSVLADNIKTLAAAMDGLPKDAGTIEEKIAIAEGGGLIETDDGVSIDISGLPVGTAAGNWLLVQGEDGLLYRVAADDYLPRPVFDSPNDVPTLAAFLNVYPAGADATWPGSGVTATRGDLWNIAIQTDLELQKMRDAVDATLALIREAASFATS